LEELNRKILDHSQPQVRRVFETLIAPGALPVLVHCTGGKDRTGLIVALLLSLLWVPDGTIAEDYALSAQYLGPLFEQMRQQARSTGRDIALPAKMLEARPECILEMLAYLRAEYGGAEEYLEVLGLVDWQREYLRESLTEPGER
ncbi:MAG: tyrosine-protein phosphatase, partial [Ktedonobacteraceae bacterium]|nr:tyrosine-protein phosphatase [Ktedonobacteraceae bacterium]